MTMPHKHERQFGFLFAAVCVIVAFWPLWPLEAPNPYWLAGAAAWLAAALLVPGWLAPLYRGWMAFGHALGWINAKILLTLVFFLIVTPVALALKLFGHDPLARRLAHRGSYWVVRTDEWRPESLRNQF
jgi:hypothetical protein